MRTCQKTTSTVVLATLILLFVSPANPVAATDPSSEATANLPLISKRTWAARDSV